MGEILAAKISKLYDYGALITLHDEMISTFIKNDDLMEVGMKISEVYKKEDNIDVVVKQVNNNKVLVEATEKYKVNKKEYLIHIEDGDIISGTITKLCIDKVFVKIAPGIDVLCTPENGYGTNDKVDIEITKSQLENNSLMGKIINLKKINEYIEKLEVGKMLNGIVKKIIDNEYYVKISTCVYAKCDFSEISSVSIGDNIKIKISDIDRETKQIYAVYIDDNNKSKQILEKVNEGDRIEGIIKSKINSIYEVITNTGLRITCKNINDNFNINDHVSIEINRINRNSVTIRGTILENRKIDEYLQRKSIGEEQHGSIIKIDENICTIKVSVGVDVICPIPKYIKIDKGDIVKFKISEIDTELRTLRGEIIEDNIEDLYDYTKPFIMHGFKAVEKINDKKKFNKNAIEEMLIKGIISERDKCIVRFLMDCRFACANQIERFLNTNSKSPFPNRKSLQNRLAKLIHYRVINSIRLEYGQMVYCIDIGGKQILDKEENEKSKNWLPKDDNKGLNIIGKALVSTEIYVRSKYKYVDSDIEFDASPYIKGDKNCKDSKQVVFNMRLKNKNQNLNILGEVYRTDDVSHAFDKRMKYIEEYLDNDLWENNFKEYGRPKVIIVVENEDIVSEVKQRLSVSYPNIMKDSIITTDCRLDEDVFESELLSNKLT